MIKNRTPLLLFCLAGIFFPFRLNAEVSKDWKKARRTFMIRFQQKDVDSKIAAIKGLYEFKTMKAMTLAFNGLRYPEEKIEKVLITFIESCSSNIAVAFWIIDKGMNRKLTNAQRTNILTALGKYKFAEVAQRLTKLLRIPKIEYLIPTMEVLGEIGDPSILPDLFKLRKNRYYRRHFGFRRTLIESIIKINDKTSIKFLIEELPNNAGYMVKKIDKFLRKTTGVSFGINYGKWGQWWKENLAKFEFKKMEPEKIDKTKPKKPENLSPGEDPRYYDIPIEGGRLAFILDTSGSMMWGAPIRRMISAKIELVGAINSLKSYMQFVVMFFNSNTHMWKKYLTPATKFNKRECIKYIKGRQPAGGTASHTALIDIFALNDNLETIYFVSDGQPTVGLFIKPEEILREVKKINRYRKVIIHTIGVYTPGGGAKGSVGKLEGFMKDLANQNEGFYKRVD